MTYRPETEDGSDRERLIRVEMNLKHMDQSQGVALRDLKTAILDLGSTAKDELIETRSRLTALEKRVDKVYWLWSAAVFIGTPVMMAVSKTVFSHFGM
jgi:hypothetical protein